MLTMKINGNPIQVKEGTTILEAAKSINIVIPTLCHLELPDMGYVNKEANCRICLVQDKWGKLIPACNTLCKEGMEVRTDTLDVINARRTNIELLLSNHPKDCLTCYKNGDCELQSLAASAHVHRIRFPGEMMHAEIDDSSRAIVRDPNKCILCKRCETMCNEVQTVGTLTDVGRGFSTVIGTQYQKPMHETNCTFCGQCLAVCPTGALTEYRCVDALYRYLNTPDKIIIAQTAPAVRVALGEEFGMEAGTAVTGKMVTALKAIGFDYVFDTNFSADLTTMEEAAEFVERFKSGENLPILTSCCPSWVKFIEHNFGDMLNIPSTCKSPHEMFGSVAKTYLAQKLGVSPDKLVVVSVMPCVAKKYESSRPELGLNNQISDVDLVITTRELAQVIKDFALNFVDLPDTPYDDPLGESSGAGAIYGAAGGVLESALRTAYKTLTGRELEKLEFTELEGYRGIKEAELDIDGRTVRVAAANGLGNARTMLERVRSGESKYDIIEIMACPGGCINGGGQPYLHGNMGVLEKRRQAIRDIDKVSTIRRAHENKSIQKIYDEFLGGPGSPKAKELLHTSYQVRNKMA